MSNIGNKAGTTGKESVDQIVDGIIKKLGVKGCLIVICDGAGNYTTTHKGLTINEAVLSLGNAIHDIYDNSMDFLLDIPKRH